MKYIVIEEFIDIHTGELHKLNQELTLTEERAKEILSVGKKIKKITKPKTTKRVVE